MLSGRLSLSRRETRLPPRPSPPQVADELRHLVSLRPTSNAPLRPVRVCVLGPLGSGRTSLVRAGVLRVVWTRFHCSIAPAVS